MGMAEEAHKYDYCSRNDNSKKKEQGKKQCAEMLFQKLKEVC